MGGWIKMPLRIEVGLDPSECIRWGPSSHPRKEGRGPQFSARIYCGRTAAWIKMSLGMEVGLNPGNIVLHGDPASPPQKGAYPQFSAVSIVGKRSSISATTEHL